MKTTNKYRMIAGSVILPFLVACQLGTTPLSQQVTDVIDTNPDPKIFEAELIADEQDVNIGGTTVHALIYKDGNNPEAYADLPDGIPIPQIVINVGDEVIVKLTNNLETNCAAIACDSSIHWHGLELDNDSDGTSVTQNHLTAGETYTYRFRAPRPGVFWFHTHMKTGPQTFAGMYGTLIVRDTNEHKLQAKGIIPSAVNTNTVVLSDTEFDDDGDVGYLTDGNAVPWATFAQGCAFGNKKACRKVNQDGDIVLVNGQNPAASIPMLSAKSGAGIRFRLINAAANRYFRLSVTDNGADNNLYRIGGEGGFLEQVRLEGGVLGTWDTEYDKGEIVLGPSSRADVVIVPTGKHGDIITIKGLGYARGGPSNNNPAGDLIQIQIDNTLVDRPFTIEEGDDVLGLGAVDDLKGLVITDFYMDPPPSLPGPGAGKGSTSETIRLNAVDVGSTAIDGVVGYYGDSGSDYSLVPFQNATRYARTGDILELTVSNDTTEQHHPFHHHGFSFQPVRIVDNFNGNTLYTFDYNEFVDVIEVYDRLSVVFRIRLDDRPRITDNRQEIVDSEPNEFFASGGAAGRWLFHCHLLLHSAVGMISELVVVDTDRDGDGFDTSEDCDDFNQNINPDANEKPGDKIDNDCNGFVDDFAPHQKQVLPQHQRP